MKKNWFVLYTKSHCELKVAALLSKKKIENYCPVNRIVSSHGNKKRIVHEVLFPSFVFVYTTDIELRLLRQMGNVIDFVYWLGKPAVIKEPEIENIQRFINQHCNVRIEKSLVNNNGNVRVISEPHLNSEVFIKNNLNFSIVLPSLGYRMMAEIDNSTLKTFDYVSKKNQLVL